MTSIDTPPPPRIVRIVTYNIRAGHGVDYSPSLSRQAQVLRELRPDIVALQEVDRATHRSGDIDPAAALAAATGLHATFAPAIGFEGGDYGIAILSRRPPASARIVPLPSPHDENRVLLVADFGSFLFAVTHLPLHEGDRLDAVDRILAELLPATKPVFLSGDWNATPGDATLRRMETRFAILTDSRQPTYPADKPGICIDYVAVDLDHAESFRDGVPVVVDEPSASDHRPILVTVPFPETLP